MNTVGDIVMGAVDSTGARIDVVYSKAVPIYAVYRTPERILIQFADDPTSSKMQRAALTPLNPVRGEINGLIDGWRAGSDSEQSKARAFDRRVADALVVALQDDVPGAANVLTGIKQDVLSERTSVARTQYILCAASGVIAFGIIASYFSSPLSTIPGVFKPLWAAAAFGALGALFSIALSIRDRSILTDLQSRDNCVDAVLRVLIGAVSAAILLCLLRGKLFTLSFDGKPLISADPNGAPIGDYLAIVCAVVAGFSERLVGDMLRRVVLSASTNPLAGSSTARADTGVTRTTPSTSSGPASAGTNGSPPPVAGSGAASLPDDQAEGCLAGAPVIDAEKTSDVELPEAVGGVEAR